MLDFLFVLAGLAFFIVSILYVAGCEMLIKDKDQGTVPAVERIETAGQTPKQQAGT